MALTGLQQFLPENAFPFVEKWLYNTRILIRITGKRHSKLGDYTFVRKENYYRITVNRNLPPELFFFVLTHEIAHLITSRDYVRAAPHGQQWKSVYRHLLDESLEVYSAEFQPLVINFARNPKANFSASPEIVKFFHDEESDGLIFLEELTVGEAFVYRKEKYLIEEKRRKRFVCKQLDSGKQYLFRVGALVEKI